MRKRERTAALPREVIGITTYAQFDMYLDRFSAGELGLVLLIGRHGTGKSESVKRALRMVSASENAYAEMPSPMLYVEGHVQPYGLYRHLWEYRDRPVVLDDLDKLYADADCVRLLKPLCNTQHAKRVAWLTNLTLNAGDIPASFVTTSNVILIANEWQSVNPNVQALEDRAIILHFNPSNAEVHRRVGQWFEDPEVYDFIASIIPLIKLLSMRHYVKGSQLRRAGLPDWRGAMLQMILPDPRLACIVALQRETELILERERVEHFTARTGYSRATYFRLKARLAPWRVH